MFDNEGNFSFRFGSPGSRDGHFQSPSGVAVTGEGNIVVADTMNNRIQVVFLVEGDLNCRGQTSHQWRSPSDLVRRQWCNFTIPHYTIPYYTILLTECINGDLLIILLSLC